MSSALLVAEVQVVEPLAELSFPMLHSDIIPEHECDGELIELTPDSSRLYVGWCSLCIYGNCCVIGIPGSRISRNVLSADLHFEPRRAAFLEDVCRLKRWALAPLKRNESHS